MGESGYNKERIQQNPVAVTAAALEKRRFMKLETYFSRYLIDKVIPEKVLFVPVDELPLPQNISVDSTGVYMQYNPDEVAPPNVGAIEYYIPYEEAEPALKRIVRK